ncbi:MAG: hypothetical protein AB7O62_17465 [Pirellulales bacterium]
MNPELLLDAASPSLLANAEFCLNYLGERAKCVRLLGGTREQNVEGIVVNSDE